MYACSGESKSRVPTYMICAGVNGDGSCKPAGPSPRSVRTGMPWKWPEGDELGEAQLERWVVVPGLALVPVAAAAAPAAAAG